MLKYVIHVGANKYFSIFLIAEIKPVCFEETQVKPVSGWKQVSIKRIRLLLIIMLLALIWAAESYETSRTDVVTIKFFLALNRCFSVSHLKESEGKIVI